MADLSTTYLGLELKNPLVVSSCGLTGSVDSIVEMEKAGAGAVVLKSIFEEQILGEIKSMADSGSKVNYGNEADDYLAYYVKQNNIEEYISLIKEVKARTEIPVIASVNCRGNGEWTSFSKRIEEAGADALEINMFLFPSDLKQSSNDIEKVYFTVINKIKEEISIPITLKIGSYFTGMAEMIYHLSESGIDGLVLFNRFISPDIDLDKMAVTVSNIYSRPEEIAGPLRWIGLMAGRVKCDLAASTGIHDSAGVLKALAAGATVACMASSLYINGIDHISHVLKEVDDWMEKSHYHTVDNLRGSLERKDRDNRDIYERAQFMKYYSDHK